MVQQYTVIVIVTSSTNQYFIDELLSEEVYKVNTQMAAYVPEVLASDSMLHKPVAKFTLRLVPLRWLKLCLQSWQHLHTEVKNNTKLAALDEFTPLPCTVITCVV